MSSEAQPGTPPGAIRALTVVTFLTSAAGILITWALPFALNRAINGDAKSEPCLASVFAGAATGDTGVAISSVTLLVSILAFQSQ